MTSHAIGGRGARTRGRLAAALAALLLATAPALADVDVRCELGFGGRWVVDAPTPVAVRLSNSGAEEVFVAISVSVGGGMAADSVHVRAVPVAAGGTREEVFLVAGPQAWSDAVTVSLEVDPTVPLHGTTGSSDRGTLEVRIEPSSIEGARSVPFSRRALGVVGDARGAVAARLGRIEQTENDGTSQSSAAPPEALNVPLDHVRYAPFVLEGFDALLLCDPGAELAARPAAEDGILDWVATGGTLVVSLGDRAAEFAATPLAAELPATWAGPQRTDYARLCERLGITPPGGEVPGPWTALRLTPSADPDSSAGAGDGPLLATRKLGLGSIVVLPYDLRMLLALPSVDDESVELLLEPAVRDARSVDARMQDMWDRVDVAGWITRTLQAGAFDPPPLPLVILGIVLYVVVVGPIDWFVLKRLRKERLTTLTFLGAVLAFTVVAYGASVFLFAAGSRVNRVVFLDLADAGRSGRQAVRVNDLAGWYSSVGGEERIRYDMPSTVGAPAFPGMQDIGSVGASLPVQVAGSDPTQSFGVLDLAFRSQRIVRGVCSGSYGPTIEVEWAELPHRGVRVVNGLPVDLDEVFVYLDDEEAYDLGPVASGATSGGGKFVTSTSSRTNVWDAARYNTAWGFGARWTPVRADVSRMLESLSTGGWLAERPSRPDLDQAAALAKCGVSRADVFRRGRALLVALASASPVPLPGDRMDGEVYAVIRKEVPIR